MNRGGPLSIQVGGTHYKGMPIQPVEYIHRNGIGFCEGAAIKYLSRWRQKGGVEDLKKAKHFIDMLIEMESPPDAATEERTGDASVSVDDLPPTGLPAITACLLSLLYQHDVQSSLFWRDNDGKIRFFVNVNDVFYWGTADAEPVCDQEDLDQLKRAIEDATAIDPVVGPLDGISLYAARRRKLRPQGAAYPENRDLWPLFDACGPEREINHGNPFAPGTKKAPVSS